MTKMHNPEFPHLELGDYLELLQEIILVDGKRLTNQDIYDRLSLSPKTYMKVKRAKV